MPAVLAETRIAAEQQSIDDIDRQLAQLEVELREALLLTDNDEEVARLDTKIASLKREREHHLLRIDSLRAQEALEQKAAAAKQRAQHIGRIETEIDELRRSSCASRADLMRQGQ